MIIEIAQSMMDRGMGGAADAPSGAGESSEPTAAPDEPPPAELAEAPPELLQLADQLGMGYTGGRRVYWSE